MPPEQQPNLGRMALSELHRRDELAGRDPLAWEPGETIDQPPPEGVTPFVIEPVDWTQEELERHRRQQAERARQLAAETAALEEESVSPTRPAAKRRWRKAVE